MRHIYIRRSLGLIWLVAAIVCGISGNILMMGLYLGLAGAFLYSAYTIWKKEKDGKEVSRVKLAEKSGIGKSTLNNIENAKVSPTLFQLQIGSFIRPQML